MVASTVGSKDSSTVGLLVDAKVVSRVDQMANEKVD